MDDTRNILLLSDDVLTELEIGTGDVIAAIEKAIAAEASGAVFTAPKSAVLPGAGRYMMTTLSTGDLSGLTIVKSVTVSPRNPARGLRGIEGIIIVQDSETGVLRAVMEAGWVTAIRTAGLSCVVASRLANPRSHVASFVGCGVQARSHLSAFQDLFPLTEVRILGRGRANIDRLCAQADQYGLKAVVCESAEEALDGADLVVSSVTLSFELEPFLNAGWLKPGAFASITDAGTSWRPGDMNKFGMLIIDDVEQEKASVKKMVDPKLVHSDLAGLVCGDSQAAFDPSVRSAFVFRGLAIGDYAVASLAYAQAQEKRLGKVVEW